MTDQCVASNKRSGSHTAFQQTDVRFRDSPSSVHALSDSWRGLQLQHLYKMMDDCTLAITAKRSDITPVHVMRWCCSDAARVHVTLRWKSLKTSQEFLHTVDEELVLGLPSTTTPHPTLCLTVREQQSVCELAASSGCLWSSPPSSVGRCVVVMAKYEPVFYISHFLTQLIITVHSFPCMAINYTPHPPSLASAMLFTV